MNFPPFFMKRERLELKDGKTTPAAQIHSYAASSTSDASSFFVSSFFNSGIVLQHLTTLQPPHVCSCVCVCLSLLSPFFDAIELRVGRE